MGGKTMVFTAYLQEEVYSKDQEDFGGGDKTEPRVSECWYPTIFFFDLDRQRVVWEIFGAEKFIGMDKKKKVSVLTNEIWSD